MDLRENPEVGATEMIRYLRLVSTKVDDHCRGLCTAFQGICEQKFEYAKNQILWIRHGLHTSR